MGQPEEDYADYVESPCPRCGGLDFTAAQYEVVAKVHLTKRDDEGYESRGALVGPDISEPTITCDGCGFRAGDDPKGPKLVTLTVPEDAWNLLSETLGMDAESGSFDDDLRREIRAALATVKVA